MISFRKVAAVLAALTVLVSMSGCGQSNAKPAPMPDDSKDTTKKIEASDVTVDNIADYLGLPDAIVVDMSNIDINSQEDLQRYNRNYQNQCKKIHDAFLECPENIILWDYMNYGSLFDKKFMYDIFWISSLSAGETYVNGEFVTLLSPTYSETDKATLASMQAEIDAATNAILAKCNGTEDIWGNCKIIHDELIRKDTYDRSVSLPHIYDIYGSLVTGNAVCQGYAYGFSYVTDKLGYNVETVVSSTHAWNWLKDSYAYDGIIDVTWDDLDMRNDAGYDYIEYDFFGLTKEEVEKVDSHAVVGINANMTIYDVGHEPFNYHNMLGYSMSSYSYSEVVRIFAMQNGTNGSMATIKFLNDQAWADAQELLADNGQLLVNAYCEAHNYYGYVRFWYNNSLRTMSVAEP